MDTLEDRVLKAVDLVAGQSQNKVTKMLVDLFKSAVLKKYKVAFDNELAKGKVHKTNLYKTVDLCFAETCYAYRLMNIDGVSDDVKENEIKTMKSILGSVKETVRRTLENHGIEVMK
ncbi:MAG: hypothetical protein IJK49_04760 [Prevotella sp.]|nr:hypothetical protein [Prevotella sp.]